ncbi:BapA/Bap/LapF family large adhesin [Aureimonas populi]|uniref:BapA/Bap/LapF family large adhesin n=1 Tax=Aureimonas populi TaxID=1701758 RepID=A0ABW5CL30_9HYPH|nr:BapA/Bap/LapF family large adhesin [Aureimonas populi]
MDDLATARLNILPVTTEVDLGEANYLALVSVGILDLQATVLGTESVTFSVEEGTTLDATFDFGALAAIGLLSDYAVVVQRWDGTQWTSIDGSGESTLLDLTLLGGNSYQAAQTLEPGQYRAFATFEGVGVGVAGFLEVGGTVSDFTEIGGFEAVPVEGNVITGEGSDTVTPTTVVSSVNGVPVNGETTIAGSFGVLVIAPDGSYTYTPNEDAAGIGRVDEFSYTITDPATGLSDTATLFVQIDSEGQGLVWDPADPGADATTVVAVADADTAAINTQHPSTPNPTVEDAIAFTWLLGVDVGLGQVVIGETSGQTGFVVAEGTTQDVSIDVAVNSVISLVDSILVTVEREVSTGIWEVVQTFGSGGVLDLVGLANESLVAELDGLEAGNYRVTVANTSVVTAAGTVTVDIASETADLSQVVGAPSAASTGNVLEDDTLASTFTEFQIESGGAFVEVANGTQVQGAYGVLTVNADGSYSYQPAPNLAGLGQEDVFAYRLVHPNGDISSATLTVALELGDGPTPPGAGAPTMAESDVIALDLMDASGEGEGEGEGDDGTPDGDTAEAPELALLVEEPGEALSLDAFSALSGTADEEEGDADIGGTMAEIATVDAAPPADPFSHLTGDDDWQNAGTSAL